MNNTCEERQSALQLLKSGRRWEVLRRVKTRLQQANEYLKNGLIRPYRPALQAIEMLMHDPFITREEIAKWLAVLNGYMEQEEATIIAEPSWPGSL